MSAKESSVNLDVESGDRKGGSGKIWKILTAVFLITTVVFAVLYFMNMGGSSESKTATHEPYEGYPWRDENGVVVEPDTECSDAPFEANGVKTCTVRSAYTNGRVDVTYYIPAGIENVTDVPFAMLLHGGLGSHWHWVGKGGVAQKMAEMLKNGKMKKPMVIAMPNDGGRGNSTVYLRHLDTGMDYENWVHEDVFRATKKVVSQVTDKSQRFIGGLSLGGFGSLRLAALHPETYAAVSTHSAVVDLQESGSAKTAREVWGLDPESMDVLPLIKANLDKFPPLRFDCGLEDGGFLPGNQRLAAMLKELNHTYTYNEYPGGHNWDFWAAHLEETLQHFSDHLA